MTVQLHDRVAVVTGAGGGLGRAHALLLASLGAKVVVNDLGGNLDGSSNSSNAADAVVNEIKSRRGTAVADYHSVEDGDAIIATAIDSFGRIDILVNNAGILRDKSFKNLTKESWLKVIDVHLNGTFSCTRAAWPYMLKQNYGRIVNTSSGSGLYGNFGQSNYSAAKSALIGFTRTLAQEGAPHNVRVNAIAPLAGTRMTEAIMPSEIHKALRPECISPVVAYLCYEGCEDNGSVFELGAGWIAKVRYQRSPGVWLQEGFTAEDVRENWKKISDFDNNGANSYPTSLQGSVELIAQGLEQQKKAADVSQQNKGSDSETEPQQSAAVKLFLLMKEFLRARNGSGQTNGEVLTSSVKADYGWIIKFDDGSTKEFTIDLKKNGAVYEGIRGKPSVTFSCAEKDFIQICTGKLNPSMAYLRRRLQIKGSVATANKFNPSLFPKVSENMLSLPLGEARRLYLTPATSRI